MTAPRFFASSEALRADRVRLDGPEGRHAAAARRLSVGESVDLCDGAGLVVVGVVAATGPNWLDVDVVHRRIVATPQPRLVVAQALAKRDRGELAVQLMTEVGVDAVVPWAAARCVAEWRGERGAHALARWRATAREAAKQARRDWLPRVAQPVFTDALADRVHAAAAAFVMHESAAAPLAGLTVPATGEVLLVIGPEGGITDDELRALTEAGALSARLGPTVLRTSTAGAVAAALLLSRTSRWAVGYQEGENAVPGMRTGWPPVHR